MLAQGVFASRTTDPDGPHPMSQPTLQVCANSHFSDEDVDAVVAAAAKAVADVLGVSSDGSARSGSMDGSTGSTQPVRSSTRRRRIS